MTDQPDTEKWLRANPLRRWRERNERTQTEIARLLGCSPGSVRAWEQGGAEPQWRYHDRLAGLLEVDAETFRKQWKSWMAKGVRERPVAGAA